MANFTSSKLEGTGNPFVGQGDLVIFDVMASYTNKTLADLENPKSLGQIVQDSTSWDGDDVEVSQIKDEQGNVITAKTTAGTIAFSFELASTSAEMIKKFLKGVNVTASTIAGWTGNNTAVGFGNDLPVISNLPIAIVNDAQTRAWVYPRCKVSSNLSLSDGLWRIKCSVVAEAVNETNLKTGMIVDYVSA